MASSICCFLLSTRCGCWCASYDLEWLAMCFALVLCGDGLMAYAFLDENGRPEWVEVATTEKSTDDWSTHPERIPPSVWESLAFIVGKQWVFIGPYPFVGGSTLTSHYSKLAWYPSYTSKLAWPDGFATPPLQPNRWWTRKTMLFPIESPFGGPNFSGARLVFGGKRMLHTHRMQFLQLRRS